MPARRPAFRAICALRSSTNRGRPQIFVPMDSARAWVYSAGTMRSSAVLLVLALAAACADPGIDPDDEEIEAGGGALVGKADADSFLGAYRWADAERPFWANDLTALELTEARFVRARCYGYDCEHHVPQTGTYEIRTTRGKTYVKFLSFTRELEGEEWISTPGTLDTYEIVATDDGVKVRKTRARRWSSLVATDVADACDATGGRGDGTTCECAGGEWNAYEGFFLGLGGCFDIVATNEDGCYETHGEYTDDDGTAIGTYCLCPIGTYETAAGCTAL